MLSARASGTEFRAGVLVLAMVSALAVAACGSEDPLASLPAEGELATPPFEVRGEAEGLLLVWFDGEGLHTAARRSEVPREHRAMVRVDDLSAAPDDRLDPELVYVADLRRAGTDGSYVVRRLPRSTFDARVSAASADEEPEPVLAQNDPAHGPPAQGGTPDSEPAPDQGTDVVLYGASWCGACRSAASFLRQRQVPFVERDIEREPGAREAMLRAARAAGVSPSGIPVIDFRGRVIQGFDQPALERAIAASRTPI